MATSICYMRKRIWPGAACLAAYPAFVLLNLGVTCARSLLFHALVHINPIGKFCYAASSATMVLHLLPVFLLKTTAVLFLFCRTRSTARLNAIDFLLLSFLCFDLPGAISYVLINTVHIPMLNVFNADELLYEFSFMTIGIASLLPLVFGIAGTVLGWLRLRQTGNRQYGHLLLPVALGTALSVAVMFCALRIYRH